MLDGMLLCCAKGLSNVCVESDAASVITMVRNMSQILWRYVYLIRRIKSVFPNFGSVKLIFREQNMVADQFAKTALGSSEKKEFFTGQDIPQKIKKLIFLDRFGIPNFRSPCN